eukprot:3278602-Pyramimonas_sp.AAC.1
MMLTNSLICLHENYPKPTPDLCTPLTRLEIRNVCLRGKQWEKVGNWTQGEERGRVSALWGVESTLAVIGTGGP